MGFSPRTWFVIRAARSNASSNISEASFEGLKPEKEKAANSWELAATVSGAGVPELRLNKSRFANGMEQSRLRSEPHYRGLRSICKYTYDGCPSLYWNSRSN